MATIIPPSFAVRYKTHPNGNSNSNGKFHLLNPQKSQNDLEISVCKKLFWDEDDYEIVRIEELKPEQICEKCLGPLRAV